MEVGSVWGPSPIMSILKPRLTWPERLTQPRTCLLSFGLYTLRTLQKLSGIMWSRTFHDISAAQEKKANAIKL